MVNNGSYETERVDAESFRVGNHGTVRFFDDDEETIAAFSLWAGIVEDK